MKISTKFLSLSTLLLSGITSYAQKGDTLDIQRKTNGVISYVRFKDNNERKLSDGANLLKKTLKETQDDEHRLSKQTTDNIGMNHYRYQQYYKGVKVEDAEYLIHGKNGVVQTINGDFKNVNLNSISPSVNEKQAIDKALNFVHAKKYKWEDSDLEKLIKLQTNNSNATYFPKGEIVITESSLQDSSRLKLAWKFKISSLSPINEQLIYVDAVTGEVIRVTPLIYDANTPINAQTRYNGTIGVTGDSFAGGFRLQENRNGVSIQTLNIQNSNNYANAIDFTNTNTDFTSTNWTSLNQDQPALDAHWGAESVLDYWRIIHNRNSLDGNGIRILGYVHYRPNGTSWGNAQWVGGTNNHFMQYGDGDSNIPNPLTSLDITSHEMGHGITEFTSNLTPGSQESGALNEGFSDIWGACVEHWAAPTKQTWLIGEDVFLNTIFNCLRDLQNPKSTTAAEGQHPNTYHGQFWNGSGEPHFNSTVLSHWFYLISNGGSGSNDNNSTFSVNSIGINEAQLIAYRTESLYLNSSADYSSVRTASIQAAIDLYGQCSAEVQAVTDGWFAVGVGGSYANSSSIAYANATTQGTCSSQTYQIWNLTASANSSNPTNWHWTSSSSSIYFANANAQNTQAFVGSGVSGTVSVTYQNSCGVLSQPSSVAVTNNSCRIRNAIVSYPNPANQEMNIQYPQDKSSQVSDNNQSFGSDTSFDKSVVKSYNVILYNDKRKILRTAKSEKGEAVKLNTADIPNGNYFLHIIEGKEVIKKQIIIQH